MRHTPQRDDHASRDFVPSSSPTNVKRRRFLLALGASTAGTAAAAAQAVAPVDAAASRAAPETAGGYRETDHVRDYYASARN